MEMLTKSIKTLFVVSIVILTAVLLSIQTVMNVREFSGSMEAQVKDTLEGKAGEISGKLDQRILQIAQKTAGLALSLTNMDRYEEKMMFGIADGYILSDSLVVGSGFWFEPNAYAEGMRYYGPYRYRDTDGSVKLTMDYSNAEYNYGSFDWYKNAMSKPGTVAWTGPYLDEVSKTTMLTSASAFMKDKKSVGTVTVDIGITELEKYVQEIKIGSNGYAFLVSNDGYYLATKDDAKNMKAKITEESNPALAALGKKITGAGDLLMEETDAFSEDSYVMVAPLTIDNLKLVLVAPKSDYDGPIKKSIYMSIVMAFLVMLILCSAMIVIFNRRIGQPIDHLMVAAGRIADGDLRHEVQVDSDDEIGALAKSLQNMSQNLKHVIGSVNGMAVQVAAASEQLTASSDQSSQASNQVANSIVSIAEDSAIQATEAQNIQTTAESLTANAQEISARTQQVAHAAEGSRESVVKGRSSIGEAVRQMENITISTNSIQESIQKLDQGSKKIGEIVGMITSIAEQTNLLALNAAIEAARAGEAGRGFAVVADEVRKLAEESNHSAQQISELVNSNHEDMKRAVEASTSGAESVRLGIATVQSADEVFQTIVVTIDSLVTDITTISDAIHEMAKENEGMLEASVKISDASGKSSDEAQSVSAATEEQSASMHEIADASRSLAKLASELQDEVHKFKI
ncbi:MAG TPA: hypothetical protein DEP57_00075 [Selenomonas sp.]|nr:hypothetical protein [Selenomonas sp.]